METATHLPPAAIAFLRDLRAHNERAWFDANRDRCEAERVEPCRALIREFAADLVTRWKAPEPLMAFLCRAAGLPW